MSTEVASAVLLIAVSIAFNLAFFELGRAFDYPNILRKEPDEILTRFHAGGSGLIRRGHGRRAVRRGRGWLETRPSSESSSSSAQTRSEAGRSPARSSRLPTLPGRCGSLPWASPCCVRGNGRGSCCAERLRGSVLTCRDRRRVPVSGSSRNSGNPSPSQSSTRSLPSGAGSLERMTFT